MVALSYSLQIYSAGAASARYTIVLEPSHLFGNAIRDTHQSIASETRWQLSSPQSAAAQPSACALARLVWLLNSSASFGQELTEEPISARFNWQPLSIIPKDERDDQCWRCGGKYVDPLAGVDTSQSPAESDLEVSAGDSDISDDSAEFYDTVIVEQGYRRLEAERVSIDRVNETVSATDL